MKDNKKIIIILISILFLLVIIALIINGFLNSNNNNSNNNSNNNVIVKVSNMVDNNVNNIEPDENTIITPIPSEVAPTNVSDYKLDKEIYKENLENLDWLKQNLSIEVSSFGNAIPSGTKNIYKFSKLNEESNKCSIITYVECSSETSIECSILTCENNEINKIKLDEKPANSSHTTFYFNKDKKIVYTETVYFGESTYKIYDVSKNKFDLKNVVTCKENGYVGGKMTYIYKLNEKIIDLSQFNEIKSEFMTGENMKDYFKFIDQPFIDEELQI